MNRIEAKPKKIDSVVLYRTGAEVTRTVRLKLPAGESCVAITDLPNAYDKSRTTVTGKGAFTVLSVLTLNKKTAQKSEAVQAQESVVLQLIAKRETLAAENAFWTSNLKVGGEAGADEKRLGEAFNYFSARIAENAVMRMQNNVALSAAQNELVILQQAEEQKGLTDERQTVEITVFAEKPCDAELTLTAFTTKASFALRYDVFSDPSGDALNWQLSALATQSTGEDFTDCNTLFSTSSAERGLNVPEFFPEFVGANERQPLMHAKRMAYAAPAMVDYCMEEEATNMAEFTQENESAAQSLFESAHHVTLQSGGDNIQIVLVQQKIKCAYTYSVMPVFDSGVYLTAKVEAGSFPFTANARLYDDGIYAGETVLTQSTETVCLARVDKLTATRKTGNRYGSNLLLGGEKTECDYTVTLTSAKKELVTVTVTDRIPVSQNKAVTVEPNELSGAELEKNTGKLVWRVKLKGGEKTVLKVRYAIINKQKN